MIFTKVKNEKAIKNGQKQRKHDPRKSVFQLLEKVYPEKSNDTLNSILKDIDDIKNYINSFSPLNSEQQRALDKFEVKYLSSSNAIDGNQLSQSEVYQVLFDNIAIGGKKVTDHIAIINNRDAWKYAKYVLAKGGKLSNELVKYFHKILMHGIDTPNAGRLRNIDITIPGSQYTPPHSEKLEDEMIRYFEFYTNSKGRTHPVILAAQMHYKLAIMHPFMHGNGHLSRLVCNFILQKFGYPLFTIPADLENKMLYFQALESVQEENNDESFCLFTVKRMRRCALKHLASVVTYGGKTTGSFFSVVDEKLGTEAMKIILDAVGRKK